MRPLDRVVSALEALGSNQSGRNWQCPAHEDRNASLSVQENGAGNALVYCHAGCTPDAVLGRLGITKRELFADSPDTSRRAPRPKPTPPVPTETEVAEWQRRLTSSARGLERLRDLRGWSPEAIAALGLGFDGEGVVFPVRAPDGALLGAVRYLPKSSERPATAPKMLAVAGTPRELFPPPERVEGNELWVVEGEPDAVTASTIGLPVVALPGAGKQDPRWPARIATGRSRVVIVSDCDEPGRDRANRLAAELASLVPDVRLIDLQPGRDDGHDLTDELVSQVALGGDHQDARKLLLRAADASPNLSAQPARAESQGGKYDGRVLDVAAMLREPDEPTPWRCEGLAADGYLTVLAGRGGEGKSWLALALAAGVARGESAAGVPCVKGRALLFDAENGPKLTIRRFRNASIGPELAIQPIDAGGLRFTDSKDSEWMRSMIAQHDANLVIFDSLRVLSSGAKESDGDEMEPIVTRLRMLARDTGAAVLLIHHRGKSESNDYRGSSTILDQADMLFTLGRVAEDPEGNKRRKIATAKCRIDAEPPPRWVAIEADEGQGLVYVTEAEPFEGGGDGARPRDDLRPEIEVALADGPLSGAGVAKAVGRQKTDQTVRRALKDLETQGHIVKDPEGRWLGGLLPADPLGDDNLTTPPRNGSTKPDLGLSGGVVTPAPDDNLSRAASGVILPDDDAPDWWPSVAERNGGRL